jgi:hypothetical protein
LFLAPNDPLLMIEDAPGRFREEWIQHAPEGNVEFVRTADIVTIRIGAITGVVLSTGGAVLGRVWSEERSIGVFQDTTGRPQTLG